MPIFNPYGRGMEYPLRCANGSANVVTGLTLIAQSIIQILGIQQGTLPSNPTLGSRLEKILFEPTDAIAIAIGATFIREALLQEGRITVRSVRGEIDAYTPSKINFSIEYRVRQTEEIQSVIYPFNREL